MRIDRRKFEIQKAMSCMKTKDIIEHGVPKGTICTVISGKNARPETIGKIAKALNCNVYDLITDEDEMEGMNYDR